MMTLLYFQQNWSWTFCFRSLWFLSLSFSLSSSFIPFHSWNVYVSHLSKAASLIFATASGIDFSDISKYTVGLLISAVESVLEIWRGELNAKNSLSLMHSDWIVP